MATFGPWFGDDDQGTTVIDPKAPGGRLTPPADANDRTGVGT